MVELHSMIVLETLGRRWFAFAFIATFLWAAFPDGGWRRAVRFLAVSFGISLAAEYASTHTGFPYGRYDYIAVTHGDEIYLSNVPLFVPLSFGTVVWAGYALALMVLPGFIRGPWQAGSFVAADGGVAAPLRAAGSRARFTLRSGAFLVLVGAAFATIIDFVIDPMTLRGSTWFLGDVYAYRSSGPYFGVPWSNFAGWLLVSGVIIAVDQLLGVPIERARDAHFPGRSPRRLGLPIGMTVFFVVLAVATSHWAIAGATAAITAGIVLSLIAAERRERRQPAAPPAEPPPAGVREPRHPRPASGAGKAFGAEPTR
jgi:uncharacterized membrane protein